MRKERRLRKKEMKRHERQRQRRKGIKYLHDSQIENINP